MFKSKWSILALAILILILATSKGGIIALASLMRFILPIVVIVLVFKFIKRKFIEASAEAIRRSMGGQTQQDEGDVIDLCPNCGEYMKPGHKCSSKS